MTPGEEPFELFGLNAAGKSELVGLMAVPLSRFFAHGLGQVLGVVRSGCCCG